MAIDQDTKDVIAATAEAVAAAVTEAQKAANGRGSAPSQTEEVDVLDAQGQTTGEKITLSRVTGKPPKNSMQIYQEQQAAALARHPAQATPDYDADPMWGTQSGQTDVDVKSTPARVPGFLKEEPVPLQPNFGWTPNPQDITPPTEKPKAENPYKDPYSTEGLTPLVDPITGGMPGIGERDPWTGKWTIRGGSGLTVDSTSSAAAAVATWNNLVSNWAKP